MITKEEIKGLIKREKTLRAKNSNWPNYWQDLAKYCLPRKGWQDTIRSTGERLKLNSIFDSTAIRSLKIMSAGFHSNLTNPSSKWFMLQTRNVRLMDILEVRMWFKEVDDIIFSVLNSSNFDTTMQQFYENNGCFGTGTVLTLEDIKDKVRFTIIPCNQVVMEEDAQGRVNRIWRTYRPTVQQAFDLWGIHAGKVVLDKIKDKPDEEIEVINFVGPRDKYDAAKEDSANMPFKSCWIEKSEQHLLEEGGFVEFPYAVGRFYKDTSDVFGFSPAMDVLAEIKLVNAQVKTMLRAAMKASDPAYIVPSSGFILPLNANPGAMNYRDPAKTKSDDLATLPTSGNIPITIEVIKSGQESIEKGFFVPLFRALSDITKQMTVPEVQRRIAENMVLLGPVVGRFIDEVLDPILIRVFFILFRAGELPMPPEILQNQELDVVYLSPLAKAQRESEMFDIESFLSYVQAIAQIKPEVLDKVSGDKAIDLIAKVKGIDPSVLNSDSVVQEIREQRAAAEEMKMKLALLNQGADTAQKGTQAEKNYKDSQRE